MLMKLIRLLLRLKTVAFRYKVALTDKTAETPTPVDVAKVTLSIGKLDITLNEFYNKVGDFFAYYSSNKLASNSTTAESLLAAAREYVKADQYPEFRVMLTNFVKTEATKDRSGGKPSGHCGLAVFSM